MAAILDRWAPSRRLERRRQRALHEILDARFGDTHITSPTEGAWNQIGGDDDKGHPPGSAASGGWSPESPVEKPSPVSRLSMESIVEDGPSHKDSHRQNFTITIPIPWASRKSHTPTPTSASTAMSSSRKEEQAELSPRSFMSSPEPTPCSFVSSPDLSSRSYLSSPNTTLPSQASSPIVIYKPVSDEYRQQLAEMASGMTRVDVRPSLAPDTAQNSSPVNVTYKPASENFVREMAEVGMRLSPILPQRETFSHPRASSKSASAGPPFDRVPSLGSHSPEPQSVPTGLPPDPRPTPAIHSPELPQGLPAQPRVSTTRSASRDPGEGRLGTTRSGSCGPAPDRADPLVSSSRGPVPERRVTRRSASRGPPSERSGNASHGRRSASCVPTSTHVRYRESVSSNSSAGSGTSAFSSPSLDDSFTNTTTGNTGNIQAATTEKTHDGSVGSATGYYAAVARDYRRIASEVEDTEYEKRRKAEMENSKVGKKRDRARQGPQELVPDTDELW
jgi:hypothetical protein